MIAQVELFIRNIIFNFDSDYLHNKTIIYEV